MPSATRHLDVSAQHPSPNPGKTGTGNFVLKNVLRDGHRLYIIDDNLMWRRTMKSVGYHKADVSRNGELRNADPATVLEDSMLTKVTPDRVG
jgi:hypothetical protein